MTADIDVSAIHTMKPVRLTREFRREQTRERLLDAARESFIDRGVAATSVEQIAEAAGYSRGAFYSNFRSKQELLLELLQRDADKTCANLRATIEWNGAPDEAIVRMLAQYSHHELESDCFPLWIEAALLSYRDSAVRERVDALRQKKLGKMAACLRLGLRRNDSDWTLQPELLALVLLNLCDGVQMFRTSNPQMTDEAFQAMLVGFLSYGLLPLLQEEGSPVDHIGEPRIVDLDHWKGSK